MPIRRPLAAKYLLIRPYRPPSVVLVSATRARGDRRTPARARRTATVSLSGLSDALHRILTTFRSLRPRAEAGVWHRTPPRRIGPRWAANLNLRSAVALRNCIYCHVEESGAGSAHTWPDPFLLAAAVNAASLNSINPICGACPQSTYSVKAAKSAGESALELVTGLVFLNDGRRNTASLADLIAAFARPLANFRATLAARAAACLASPCAAADAPCVLYVSAEDVVQFLGMLRTQVDLVRGVVHRERNGVVPFDLAIVR